MDKIIAERDELLEALKKLWSVRSTPITYEQRNLQFKTWVEVEDIINKYKK